MFHLGGEGPGPGGQHINLQKCTKNQAKWGNGTLNIAFLKTKMLFNSSPNKMEFWLFLHFWPCQGSLSAIGAKNSLLNGQMATYRKTEGIQSYVRIWGRYDPIELGPSEPQKGVISSFFLAHSDTTVCPFPYSVSIVITIGRWSPISKALKLSKHIA